MYRILLVEDDKNIRDLVFNYFTKKEKDVFKVDIAPDGQTGIEKAYENNYDLLLLDVMLPELDGFSICKEIRKNSDVPIFKALIEHFNDLFGCELLAFQPVNKCCWYCILYRSGISQSSAFLS